MKNTDRDKLLKKLKNIKKQGNKFFDKAAVNLDDITVSVDRWDKCKKTEYWDQLNEKNKKTAISTVTKVVNETPLIAECARLTPYLSQTDQIDLGHAIKGLRSSLRLCRYRYWSPEILHDEGHVLGVEPAGQTDNEGINEEIARKIFLECYERILGIVELVNPITVEIAEKNVVSTGQSATSFKPNTAFVMMWMDDKHPELEDVYNTVKKCFRKMNISAKRADEIEHDGKISEKIIEKIKTTEFLFADLTGARPNVYYEIGYAHALSKRVILFRKAGESIHFDLANYNCPEYTNLVDLEKKLMKRLESMTGRTIKNK